MSEPTPAVDALLADQRERWEKGEGLAVEAYLRRYPALGEDVAGLLDLIYHEVYLRERRGESPGPAEYVRRFPHLEAELRLQFEVHAAIGQAAEAGLPEVPGLELLAEIGRGGMGVVYRARDERLGTPVAVKLLGAEHFGERSARKRFLTEARAAALLDHPHLVKLHRAGECAAGPYLVMELVEGTTLEAVLRRGPPPVARAVGWLIPVAEALHYAHGRGVIHRDLKPANILLEEPLAKSAKNAKKQTEEEERSFIPKVADFGLARGPRVPGFSSTGQGVILGTPAYMPPEQAGEAGVEPGPASDVYSLGAVLYALLTGRPPFAGDSFVQILLRVRSEEPAPVRSLRPEVPEALDQVCRRCLNKRPADRYPTARDMAEALRGLAGPAGAALVAAGGRWLPLGHGTTLVGRSAGCDLVLTSPGVSRRHCRLTWEEEGRLAVEDLASSRGTRVNGRAVSQDWLRDGDRLDVAEEAFEVFLPPPPAG